MPSARGEGTLQAWDLGPGTGNAEPMAVSTIVNPARLLRQKAVQPRLHLPSTGSAPPFSSPAMRLASRTHYLHTMNPASAASTGHKRMKNPYLLDFNVYPR
jgi:hypothetical protein